MMSMISPVPTFARFSSGFGTRTDPVTGQPGQFHPGQDLAVPTGTPVQAVADGVVSYVTTANPPDYKTPGSGNAVWIDHGNGITTASMHFSQRLVNVGQKVKQGQIIGYSGGTGYVTGPHLHFEVRLGGPTGTAVDPMPYIQWSVLKADALAAGGFGLKVWSWSAVAAIFLLAAIAVHKHEEDIA